MDRWVEVDIDWFGSPPWDGKVAEFVDRTLPFWDEQREHQGVCFNVGWLADLVTEWTGRPDQALPLRSRRFSHWAALTYDDLRAFLSLTRRAAAAAGVPDLKLGILVAGLGEVVAPPVTGAMYDLFSSWHDRHPELYPLDISPLPGPDLDPRVPLEGDDYHYATRPDGIRAGEPFPEFMGEQWGSLARFLELDLIHYRDGFLGPLLYTRVGPYGTTASSDPDENWTWTDAVRRLFRASKEAHPDGLVMAYSSGISGTAEWMTGCVDLEAVVADGALDIFIDQTWGGAWQDWWDDLWKGWTFQHAYLLGHGAQIRGGNRHRAAAGQPPTRHYKLIETWDGWEPWDTLHDVPGKLEWACWAFSHAAILGEEGQLHVPEGTYISWMNDWNGRLIGARDVAWLTSTLDAAERSAEQLEAVYGPLLVHGRQALVTKGEHAPDANASEWIEDHVGMLMKWGTPVLAGTRTEWLPASWPDGALLQLPGDADAEPRAERPSMAVGRADLVGPRWLRAAAATAGQERVPAGYRLGHPTSADLPDEERVHLPDHVPVRADPAATTHYATSAGPLLSEGETALWWQPPDVADPGNPLTPRSQIGALSPYVEAARALSGAAARAGGIRTEPTAVHEPVTVQVWRSAGTVHVLAGNLESRLLGDARFPRTVTVVLPRARLGLEPGRRYELRALAGGGSRPVGEDAPSDELRLTIDLPPEGCVIGRLEPAELAAAVPGAAGSDREGGR